MIHPPFFFFFKDNDVYANMHTYICKKRLCYYFVHFDFNEETLSNLCCILGNFRSSLLSDPLIRKKIIQTT